MALSYDEFLAQFPEEQRAEIAARAAELIREERSLRELRESVAKSQAKLAQDLGIGQAAISKIERATDLYLSTLREFIAGIGGELNLIVTFPDDRPPVQIAGFRPLKRKRPGAQRKPRRKGGKVA
jgi:transcriptional regulator with XRE-family HTH domain